MKQATIMLSAVLTSFHLFAQINQSAPLFIGLKAQDSLLFNVGFNTCDITQFETLVSEDFEFYHDKSGVTSSKAAFINSIKDGLCKLHYKPKRELIEDSLEVYPLENNGVLYGAIQIGKHQFYAIEEDHSTHRTSVARFVHVWVIENEQWKLSRGLSYDHQ